MKGSVGISFVMLSASSGISENAVIAAAVDATDVTIEEVRAYRRRTVRRRKKLFQSSATAELELGDVAELDAWRIRHNEGVKKDDSVLPELAEGGLIASGASLDDARR